MSVRRSASCFVPAACVVWSLACGPVGPNYMRPPVITPDAFRFDDVARAESFADLPWWQVFDDPALQALIREAVENNLDLRVAAARVEEARAQAGIVGSFLYPQIDGTASYGGQQNSSGDGVRHGGLYALRLSWEVDLFGRIRREHEAALAQLLATEDGRRGVIVTLVGDVATTYFTLRELDWEVAIARRMLRSNDETVAYFQNRLEGGVSNRLEVDQVRANRAQTAASIPDFEREIAVAENALSLLLGRAPGAIVRQESPPAPAAPAIPPGLPSSLLERRPDVMQAEQLLVAANADVGAAKALFFPAVGLSGLAGGISGDLLSLLGGAGAVWSASADLLQPIYNAGRNKRNLEAARARFDGAVASYQKSALNAYREVANALITIQKLTAVRTERQTGVDAWQDATTLARDRYETGVATSLEILIADQQLFQQQVLLVQAFGAEYRARADLYRALGGGWRP